ncbi:MAG: carbonic anhydrase [Candidatus Aenigmarchaeota archaeon]|nr:carbonic anhydrase [Candidatus Aenigmarchaeota archaeon]
MIKNYVRRLLPSELHYSQSPQIGLIICSDSRVSPGVYIGKPVEPGEVFISRNIGNQATYDGKNPTPEVSCMIHELDSIRRIIIGGHSDCDAVEAATLPEREFEELHYSIRQGLSLMRKRLYDVAQIEGLRKAEEENVHNQVEFIVGYLKEYDSRKVDVMGMYYDFSTGEVSVININGNRNIKSL